MVYAFCLVLVVGSAWESSAGILRFSRTTDTVSLSGDSVMTTAATYEAVVMPFGGGSIFNEWKSGYEDKYLGTGPTGYTWTHNPYPQALTPTVEWTLGEWHHIAYVFSEGDERLFLDGLLVGHRGTPTTIRNGSDSTGALGAIFRDGGIRYSFIGLLKCLRISTVARYSGDSFPVPVGDLSSDQYTNLLYSFDEPVGSTTVSDLSGNGRTGTLGVGFTGATSPEFVPEPSSVFALACGLMGLLAIRRRKAG